MYSFDPNSWTDPEEQGKRVGTLFLVVVTFPEEPYYPWSTFECGEHDSDPAVLTYVRDCLDSWDCSVSFRCEKSNGYTYRFL